MIRKYGLMMALTICLMLTLVGCTTQYEKTSEALKKYETEKKDYDVRISDYNNAAGEINSANEELDKVIDTAQELINKAETPLKETTFDNLKNKLSKASEARVDDVEVFPVYDEVTINEDMSSEELEKIEKALEKDTKKMNGVKDIIIPSLPDYSKVTKDLNKCINKYNTSVKAHKQVTNPSEKFVIKRLQAINGIEEIKAVTEKHDPNGQLHKAGGYTSSIYFSYNKVDKSKLFPEPGDDIIDIGTDGGGCVEVYASVENANSRNEYLGVFDGGILSSGSHTVIGTVLVRTSCELTATEQKKLTNQIIKQLTKVKK